MRGEDSELIRRSAAAHYSEGQPIWPAGDRWSIKKAEQIDRICRDLLPSIWRPGLSTLNAGAGSHRYAWIPADAIALDRFPKQLAGVENAVVGDVEKMPFPNDAFDLVICIGSVLNYLSATVALMEIGRVTKPGGALLLHFETSNSLEHFGSRRWRADAVPFRTVNNGKPDLIWVYSQDFMYRTLQRVGFRIEARRGFNMWSAAMLRLGLPQRWSARMQPLDHWIPIRAIADDIILVGRKPSEAGF
jgi:SAM-dependent methyltransferase